MKRRWQIILLVLLAWPLQATTVKPLDLDGLVATAHAIVVGTIASSRTHWGQDGRMILTEHTIRVEETLKGAASGQVRFTTVGGTIDDLTLYVSGMPAFEEGEKTVVFLEEAGAYRTVVGMGQGKFFVEDGIVRNDISDLDFVGPAPATPILMRMDVFRDEIRRRVDPAGW
jgi:hypothetical protein